MNELAPNDRSAAEWLIHDLADPKGCNRFSRWSDAYALLPALSLSELRDLAELFEVPKDGHKSELQTAAQIVEDALLDSAADPSSEMWPASHTIPLAVNASELGDLTELINMSAAGTKSVPPAAAQSAESAPLPL